MEEKTRNDESGEKDGLLFVAAKALGSVAGKVASLGRAKESTAAGTHTEAAAIQPNGKFAKSHKSRLPRKVKKATKKLQLARR